MSRILIFEANGHIREILVNIIQKRFPETRVKYVLNRRDCLAAAKDFSPDILIMGVSLYSSKDWDLLERIRTDFPAVTILFITEYDIDEYRKEANLRGVHHIISKELWTGSEILARINSILSANGEQAGQQIRPGKFTE